VEFRPFGGKLRCAGEKAYPRALKCLRFDVVERLKPESSGYVGAAVSWNAAGRCVQLRCRAV
jgi:hypothetical protein